MRTFRIALSSLAAAGLVAAALTNTASGEGEKPAYVGDKTCMKCHFAEQKSWKKTPMAKSMKTLAPTTEADDKALFDKKKAAGLDPAKDYTTDEKCLKCHTTGFGTETGYPKDMKAEGAEARAKALGSVSCEACHGPGSLYVKFKTAEIEKNKDAKFTFEQLAPMGLTKPDEATCKTCHNDQGPTKAEFKFEESKGKTHDRPAK